ncbi:MAG: DUF3822 family protein [Microscillaceae bacterium]|nr:DUF3822 family protein [Microscillaceae bacterium]
MKTDDRIFKQELSIKDTEFDIDSMAFYCLYISVGHDNLRFCIIDSKSNRCVLLEDYRFFNQLSTDELIASLNRIYDNDLFLKANFWQKINIIPKGLPFTLIPREFFEESSPEKYLNLSAYKNESYLVVAAEQQSVDAINIFYAEKKLVNWFHKTYPTRVIEFTHQSAAFIEGVKRQNPKSKQSQTHIFIDNNYFILLVVKEGQLEFCNVFPYHTSNDFIYFVLFVMDELRLDKESCPVKLYGNIDHNSEIFQLIRTYMVYVSVINEQPNWLKFGFAFEEINNYQYFDLYGMHLCAQS